MSELDPPRTDEPAAPRLVRASVDPRAAEGWSLVLAALGIAHEVVALPTGWGIAVAPGDAPRAGAALDAHDRETREEAAAVEPVAADRGRSYVGWISAVALLAFHVLVRSGRLGSPRRWLDEGRAAAELILGNEPWRAITALTLHADYAHVAGNGIAAVIFVGALGRWVGGGLALLATLAAGAAGNVIVAAAYGRDHNSIGASTATFAAIGLLGGLQFVRWFSSGTIRMRRRRAWSAVAACLGLFAMLGVGGERTDVLAHLFGLAAGLVLGLGLAFLTRRRAVGLPLQVLCSIAAAAALVGAWALALR